MAANQGQQPAAVLVHGLWMSGFETALLGRRLGQAGIIPHRFPYSSLRSGPAATAKALAAFIKQLPAKQVHLVGHSLGGRFCELLLAFHPELAPGLGRVVTLATPFAGSHLARRLASHRLSRPLLGAAAPALTSGVKRWRHPCPLGVIAGDRGLGLGHLLPDMPRPHDGTVALAETMINGASDRITVPHGHLPMLYNRRVAELVITFLKQGSFAASGSPPP